ncbi:hypothetical protein OF83DRAFT_1179507 [Amylostereum chailletii]|nr:hypothetical protein OF83DRAFT_1179507 [Amylostereum chailletii]
MSDCLRPEQVSVALTDLTAIKYQRIFPLLLGTFFFAVLTVLVIASTYVLSSKGLRSRSRLLMLISILTMYALSAALWAIDVDAMWNDLSILIPFDLAGGDGTSPANDSNYYTSFAEQVLLAAIFIMSDTIVLWRACVIWSMHKGMRIFSVVLIVVQICIWVVYMFGATVYYSLPGIPASFLTLGSPSATVAINASALSWTLIVNVWATSMIAYKTWIHRRDVRLYLSNRTQKSAVEAVFLILVESGVLYSILGVVFTLFETVLINSDAALIAGYFWASAMKQISGIYLTLVITIVALQQSHLENTLSNVRPGAEISAPLSFRVPQTIIRTDDMEQQCTIHVTIPDTQIVSGPDIVVVSRESTNSLSGEGDDHAGIKPDEKSGYLASETRPIDHVRS